MNRHNFRVRRRLISIFKFNDPSSKMRDLRTKGRNQSNSSLNTVMTNKRKSTSYLRRNIDTITVRPTKALFTLNHETSLFQGVTNTFNYILTSIRARIGLYIATK